jgi:putative membrane protein
LQATAVLLFLAQAWGWGKAAGTAVLISALGWSIEAIGTTTGWPFGNYIYTERLQPHLGAVPLLVPLAWFMMLPVCWAVAINLAGSANLAGFKNLRGFILISAAAMTAWDLFLDPQMVLWDFWQWQAVPPFNYFGIPWQNYAGWFLSAAVMTLLAHFILRPAWEQMPTRPFLLIYAATWFLETFGLLLFWGLIGPALVGGFIMGGILFAAWRKGNN